MTAGNPRSPIRIVPYDPRWPAEFAVLGARLRAALGPEALRIDHIGSTSVPDLPAKDVIDVQVTVGALDLAPLLAALGPVGLRHASHIDHDHCPAGVTGSDADWAKLLFDAPEDERPAHVHVRCEGRPNQRYPLLFRDYLRANPAAAGSYALIKRQLADRFPDDVDAYYAIKDPVCDLIVDAAERWAAETGWEPGPSDA